MDKTKSRTYMLAAGRKKLQQFRQKKDHKGGAGKPPGKAGKDSEPLAASECEAPSEDPSMADDCGFSSEAGSHGKEHDEMLRSEQCNGEGATSGLSAIEDVGGGAEYSAIGDGAYDVTSRPGVVPEVEVCLIQSSAKDCGAGRSPSCESGQVAEGTADDADKNTDGMSLDPIGGTISCNAINQEGGHLVTFGGNENERREWNLEFAASSPEGSIAFSSDDASMKTNEIAHKYSEDISNEENSENLLSCKVASVIKDEYGAVIGPHEEIEIERKEITVQPSGLELASVDGDSVGQEHGGVDLLLRENMKCFNEEDSINSSVCESIRIITEEGDNMMCGSEEEGPCKRELLAGCQDEPCVLAHVTVGSESVMKLLEERAISIEGQDESEREEHSFFPMPSTNLSSLEGSVSEIETVKSHLYQACVENNLLLMQLADVSEEVPVHPSHEVSALLGFLEEARKSNAIADEQLLLCRSELHGMKIEKEACASRCLSMKEEVESVRAHLFTTHILKDFLQLQLVEDSEANMEVCQQYSDEMCRLQKLANESLESKSGADEELDRCKSQLLDVIKKNEVLEIQCFSMKNEVVELSDRVFDLQNRLDRSQEELTLISEEIAEYRGSVEILKSEKVNLIENLNVVDYARKDLEEVKELVSQDNHRLSFEVSQYKESLHVAFEKQVELEGELMDMRLSYEQLIEENVHLRSSGDIYVTTMKEIAHKQQEQAVLVSQEGWLDRYHVEGLSREDESCGGSSLSTVMTSHKRGGFFRKIKVGDSDILVVLEGLKGSLEKARKVLKKLESSIAGIDTLSVPKLGEAIESKTHYEYNIPDDISLDDGGTGVPYAIREHISSFISMLKQMELDIGNAQTFLFDAKQSTEPCSQFNIECETQMDQNDYLKSKIDELVVKHFEYKSRIDDLQGHLNDIDESAKDKAGMLLTQTEILQKEVMNMTSLLKQEGDSVNVLVSEALEKLDGHTGFACSSNHEIFSHMMASSEAAVKAIINLNEKLEAASLDQRGVSDSYAELNELFVDLQRKNDLASKLVHKIYGNLRELVSNSCEEIEEAELAATDDEMVQILPEICEILTGKLCKSLDERVNLLSTQDVLKSELLNRNHEIEELIKRCHDLADAKDGIESMLLDKNNDIEEFSKRCHSLTKKLENCEMLEDCSVNESTGDYLNNYLISKLEESVSSFLHKYEEAMQQVNLSKNYLHELNMIEEVDSWSLPLPDLLEQKFVPRVIKLFGLQESLDSLISSNIQLETEMLILKEELKKVRKAHEASHSEFQSKLSELDLSEQRLSSLREKLSIAVAKGKGLVVQRDSLKQSLLEKTSELENCEQELAAKESLLHEVEAKLKSCSDVERIEALESELSYIRNSTSTLRESFLLKDSVIQKIEEVLEDLDLPEHFHSRDIVEKVEVLARVAAGNPLTDWDQKSSVAGSQSDTGFAVTDTWKDDLQPHQEKVVLKDSYVQPSQGLDESKIKYEELLNRLYSLAEHNDMLEQSLMERNDRLLKLEEALDGIVMPSQLRTMELDNKIEWLGRSLSEAQQERISLKHRIENLEVSSDMLIADLEESHKKISELSAEVVAVKSERGFFSESLDKLRFECLNLTEKSVQDEAERGNLQRGLADLHDQIALMVMEKNWYDAEIRKLYELVCGALDDNGSSSYLSGSSHIIESLDGLLKALIDKYMDLSANNSICPGDENKINLHHQNGTEQGLLASRSELGEVCSNLALEKEETNNYMELCSSLKKELENVENKVNLLQEEKSSHTERYESLLMELEQAHQEKAVLQEQLTQEQQKSMSAREKLNVAVRKGKGLVQQRDSMKHDLDEMCTMMEQLKAENKQKIDFHESEKLSLMARLTETEQCLQNSNQKLSQLLTCLLAIEVRDEVSPADPFLKIERIRKFMCDLDSAVVSSEQEAKKSKRASELLLAELNEVHERLDVFQEELVDVQARMLALSNERDVATAEKTDALSCLQQLRIVHAEEEKALSNNHIKLKNSMDKLRKCCFDLSRLLSNLFSRDTDLLCQVDKCLQSLLDQLNDGSVPELPVFKPTEILSIDPISRESNSSSAPLELTVLGNIDQVSLSEPFAATNLDLHECIQDYGDLKKNIQKHSLSIDQQATRLWRTMQTIQKELVSQKNLTESQKREVNELELMNKRKDFETQSLIRNLALLFEACDNAVSELEKRTQEAGTSLASGKHASESSTIPMISPSSVVGKAYLVGDGSLIGEDSVRSLVDTLALKLKDSGSMHRISDVHEKELKAALLGLKQELKEKDSHTNRICSELVDQIKEAESVSQRYSFDLSSARAQINELQKQVENTENGKKLLEFQVSELKVATISSRTLQDKIKSLEHTLVAKDQEIESLMQALDEEESQMEVLENRKMELESLVVEKNHALDTLEASRSKALLKLSTTVSKFDELHDLSESLLTEIESHQTQLQGRDSEISFLRQEVTRCTNEVLASETINKKYSSEFPKLLKWMRLMASRFGVHEVQLPDDESSQTSTYMEVLEKNIVTILAELDNLRLATQNKESLLQVERGRVEELLHQVEIAEVSLREKETRVVAFQGERGSGQSTSTNLAADLEIEQVRIKGASSVLPIVRGGRKVNGDHVAIAIDGEHEDNLLDDDDDDKAHGFKSLTMSRIVPRISRPVADRIDAIWVSSDRLLMRQPTLRLGVLVYWIALHALLASIRL